MEEGEGDFKNCFVYILVDMECAAAGYEWDVLFCNLTRRKPRRGPVFLRSVRHASSQVGFNAG